MNKFFLHDLWKCSNKFFFDKNIYFYDFFFDTRNIIKGDNGVYFCFEKNYKKAINYIKQAIEKNVVAVVSSFYIKTNSIPILVNKNPLQLLQKFSEIHLQKFPDLNKIAITGSNGKTIVKEWLCSCLQDKAIIVRSPKSYNSQIGVPISVLQTKKNHQIGIFECGISNLNEMKNIQRIIKPQIGILTNIEDNHIENFSSTKELINEKCTLFKSAKKIFLFINNDEVDNYLTNNFKTKLLIRISTSKKYNSDIQLLNKKNNLIKIRFFSEIHSFKIPVNLNDITSINNILIIISFLWYYGFSKESIQKKIIQLESISMRLELKSGTLNSIILNDTFNADFSSVKIALEKFSYFFNKKKIIVITDVLQFGEQKYNLYKKIFNLLNSIKLKHIFLVGDIITKYRNLSKNPNSIWKSTKDLIQNFNLNNITDCAILVKGTRKFKLEQFVNFIENQSHETILEINLDAILHNIKIFKNFLNSSTKIMAMVKANSYGMGICEIAKFLQHYGIDYLGVAYADEGVLLRKNGIYIPIMIMNPEENAYDLIINYQLEPEIYSLRILKLFSYKLKEKSYIKKFPIHIKIDSGMHRLGFQKNQIQQLIKELKKYPNLYIRSIFTHLANADNKNSKFTLFQIKEFEKLYKKIVLNLEYYPLKHALNSHGIINYSSYQFDMVRLGIGMYGYIFDELINSKLINAIVLKTKISQIIAVKKGDSVGYNRKYIANRNTKIATLPIGYADGIFRKLGNGTFEVLIKNKKLKIVGSICMDMMMIDVNSAFCKEGDEVIIYGSKSSVNKASEQCETIPYELLTAISNRVKRILIKN